MRVLFVVSGNHGKISPVIQNQGDSLINQGVHINYFLIMGKGLWGYLKNVRKLRQHLLSNEYDAIHAHYSLTAIVASLAGCKHLIVSLMGSDVMGMRTGKFLIRFFSFFFSWKKVIVKSKEMYDTLGLKNAIVLPNGVDIDKYMPLDSNICKKRLGWDTNSVHVLFPANPQRPEKDYELAKSSVDLIENGVLHSFVNVPNEETPIWYNAADVVLMTSKWEGSPNAIKEAMACNRPIVSTDVGDVKERICGVNGCFVVKDRTPLVICSEIMNASAYKETLGRRKIIMDNLDSAQTSHVLERIYNS